MKLPPLPGSEVTDPPETPIDDGKLQAGGFEIPIGFLSGNGTEQFRDLKWQVYDRQIRQKIFAKLGVEPRPLAE